MLCTRISNGELKRICMSSYKKPVQSIMMVCVFVATIFTVWFVYINPACHTYSYSFSSTSPDGRFEVRFYRVNDVPLGWLIMPDAQFIRVYEKSGKLIYQSSVRSATANGMPIVWPDEHIGNFKIIVDDDVISLPD